MTEYKYTNQVRDQLSTACGNRDDWTAYDLAIEGIAEHADEEIERLTAEVSAMRVSLQAIAKHYTPNWKPGDTHVSTQRLSGIAHDALAVCASGSPKPCDVETDDRPYRDHWYGCDVCQKRDPMAPADGFPESVDGRESS